MLEGPEAEGARGGGSGDAQEGGPRGLFGDDDATLDRAPPRTVGGARREGGPGRGDEPGGPPQARLESEKDRPEPPSGAKRRGTLGGASEGSAPEALGVFVW